jgi:glyoxylase-like metal-dependent hydrolase (beta-lactamase superfamily II)
MALSLQTLSIETFVLGDFATNAYVVWDEAGPADACWVIDCPYEPEAMIDFIESKGLTPALCILTHCHCDHVAGLSKLRLRLGPINTLCHRAEKEFNEDPNLNLSGFIPPAVSAPPPDACLNGGEMLELGNYYFRVLFTPGHSPGGITLWNAELGVAFDGDTLFAGSIGRLDFPTSDPEAMRRSLELLLQLPDETRLLSGHGPATTVGAERRSNPYLRPGAF